MLKLFENNIIIFKEYPSPSYYLDLRQKTVIKNQFPGYSIIPFKELKESTLALNIYYQYLSYTHINQMPKSTIADLLASLGGNLGLFMGVSMLTLVELVEIGIAVSLIIITKYRGKFERRRFEKSFEKKYKRMKESISTI